MRNTAPSTADFHRTEVHAAGTPFTGLGTLAVAVITIAALYFGREVFVPLALAVLLSFALGPPVLLLRRWHINRVLAVVAVVGLAFISDRRHRRADRQPAGALGREPARIPNQHYREDPFASGHDDQQRRCRACRDDAERSRQRDHQAPGEGRAARQRTDLPSSRLAFSSKSRFPSRSANPTRRRSNSSCRSPRRCSNLWRRPASSSSL